MAQVFSPGATLAIKLGFVALAALVVSSALALRWSWSERPAQDEAQMQPVPFSHKHHAGDDGIDCRYCHQTVETTATAGMPSTQTCMNCHSQLWSDSPYLEPVRASFRDNKPIQWERVHDLPEYVYFNHSIHVAKGVGCSTCHGQIDNMPAVF